MNKLNINWNLLLVICVLLSSCIGGNKETKDTPFKLTGTINHFQNGKMITSFYKDGSRVIDTIQVIDGKFTITGDFPVPTSISLDTEDGNWRTRFWVENGNMTIKAGKERGNTVITGSSFQDGSIDYTKASSEYYKTHRHPYEFSGLASNAKTEAEKLKVKAEEKKAKTEYLEFQKNYIKTHSENPYVAELIWVRLTSKIGGESAQELKKWADLISPNIRKHPSVAKMFDMLNLMLKTEAGLDKFVEDATNETYKVDKTYKGGVHKDIAYLAIFDNNNLCALNAKVQDHASKVELKADEKKYVQIINPNGEELSRFEIKTKGKANTLAVDSDELIYVFESLEKEETSKYRGKTMKYMAPDGVNCLVYDTDGNQLKKFKLDGLKSSSGARIFEDKILVSDVSSQLLKIYKKETGKLVSTVNGLRPCCSILDFDVDKKGNIIVANLGSFRVDAYNFSGEKLVSFGQRGKGINDFSGCCNPVSVRKLDNGCIITVEKTPTRIKVYSKGGAHIIDGIDELVKGCFHIPVTSDTKNNIYLASPEKGLVKCVVVK